jgi:hypothetical protein
MTQRDAGYKGRTKFVKIQDEFKRRAKAARKGIATVLMAAGRSSVKGTKIRLSSHPNVLKHRNDIARRRRRRFLRRQQRQHLARSK